MEFFYGLFEMYQCSQCYQLINMKTIIQTCTNIPQTVDTPDIEDHSWDEPQFLMQHNGNLDWSTNSVSCLPVCKIDFQI